MPLEEDNLRSAPERKPLLDFGCCGTYGSASSVDTRDVVVAGAALGFTGLFGFDAVLLDLALS